MVKKTKEDSYKKLPTSELLNIERDTLTDEEEEALIEEIDERQPFKQSDEWVSEVEDRVESLEKELNDLRRKLSCHDHKDNNVVIKL